MRCVCFCVQVNDIKEVRIDGPLNAIGDAMLVTIPEDASWTASDFLNNTKEHCEKLALQLDAESRKVSGLSSCILSL